VVRFVVGEMPLEDMDHRIDRADQSGRAGQQVHSADASGTESVDTIGQLVMDVGGGHHGQVALGPGSILDAPEDSPLTLVENSAVAFLRLLAATLPVLSTVAFWRFLGDSSSHSKAFVAWKSEDVFLPLLFQNLRRFSSLFVRF
jgi:hypothetical protein